MSVSQKKEVIELIMIIIFCWVTEEPQGSQLIVLYMLTLHAHWFINYQRLGKGYSWEYFCKQLMNAAIQKFLCFH